MCNAVARERGIVSVNISPKAGSRTRVARALMERFALQGAFVIPSGDEQALALARFPPLEVTREREQLHVSERLSGMGFARQRRVRGHTGEPNL